MRIKPTNIQSNIKRVTIVNRSGIEQTVGFIVRNEDGDYQAHDHWQDRMIRRFAHIRQAAAFLTERNS